jgi:hypothetical protein
MLVDYSGIAHGHQPSAEFDHARAKRLMDFMERRMFQHGTSLPVKNTAFKQA